MFEENFILSPSFCTPQFAAQAFSHNQTQIKTSLKESQTYYSFNNVKKNAGVYRILADAHPYTLLGQSGQCIVDFEYQMPSPSDWPTNTKYVFPSVNLFQVSIDGIAAKWVRPDQTGKVRLVLNDPDNSISSLNLSFLSASGEEILVPASSSGGHEYVASIPASVPEGFIDVIARASDKHGSKIELTASPAFYYGKSMDHVHYDARLRMATYKLNNVNEFKYNTGDTLKYTLTYNNYGNTTARNITATFPTTPYFKPIGLTTFAIDFLGVNDSVNIPIMLIFLGKNQSTVAQVYYTPTIAWTSNGTSYLRKHNVLVDLQGSITNVETARNEIPDKYELYQNYPNPFNPTTTIEYEIPITSNVKIVVYDILGRNIETLLNKNLTAGNYKIDFDGTKLSSGIYLYKITAGGFVQTKKMILIK